MDIILRDFPSSIETERLVLRCPRPGDGPEFHAALQDSIRELRPWMSWAVSDIYVEEAEARMRNAQLAFLARTDLLFLIILKGTNIIVGSTGLHYPDWSVPSFEIGYWARTPYAGKGYITEAVIGLRDFAFSALGGGRTACR